MFAPKLKTDFGETMHAAGEKCHCRHVAGLMTLIAFYTVLIAGVLTHMIGAELDTRKIEAARSPYTERVFPDRVDKPKETTNAK